MAAEQNDQSHGVDCSNGRMHAIVLVEVQGGEAS